MTQQTNTHLKIVSLRALRPKNMRERVHILRSGGFTVNQLIKRLPTIIQDGLGGESPNPQVRISLATEEVRTALNTLVCDGFVKMKTVPYHREFNTKGFRRVQVDVFRLKLLSR